MFFCNKKKKFIGVLKIFVFVGKYNIVKYDIILLIVII